MKLKIAFFDVDTVLIFSNPVRSNSKIFEIISGVMRMLFSMYLRIYEI